jgi:hypothetical protein
MDKKQREALRHRQYRKSKKEDMNKLKTLHAYILRKDSELLKHFEAVTARRVLIVEQNLLLKSCWLFLKSYMVFKSCWLFLKSYKVLKWCWLFLKSYKVLKSCWLFFRSCTLLGHAI